MRSFNLRAIKQPARRVRLTVAFPLKNMDIGSSKHQRMETARSHTPKAHLNHFLE